MSFEKFQDFMDTFFSWLIRVLEAGDRRCMAVGVGL